MTTSQLIECIIGKKICVTGKSEKPNATAFEDRKIDEIGDTLVKAGFNRYGYEKMINGRTGELMEAMVFIGPTYYQRLKHMVADKVTCRSYGAIQNLNRQPTEGRARAGGLRVGKHLANKSKYANILLVHSMVRNTSKLFGDVLYTHILHKRKRVYYI